MASIVSIIPIVLLFILMLGFKMAGHKSALLTLVITVLLALFAASPLGMIAPEHAEDSVIALTGWAVVEGILKAVFPILIIILMAIYSYNILVESKQIEVIKRKFTSITCCHPHRTRIQTDVLGSGFLDRKYRGYGIWCCGCTGYYALQ